MYNPYAQPPQQAYPPPYEPAGPPPVWPWFIAYAVAMALLYLTCSALGAFLLVAGDKPEDQIQGGVMAIMGFFFMLPFAAAPFLPKKPWAWTFNLVMICLSMTSGCCMPISIPLLIFWIKPETKAFFQRS